MTVSSPSVGKDRLSPDLSASTAQRDDGTTRYLCAAAHRYATFADQVIAAYLVEKVRTVSPTPGLDLAAVLRDAVAARCRRRVRDAVLLTLLVLLAVHNPLGTVLWTLGAALIRWRLGERRLPGWLVATVAPLAVLGLVIGLGSVRTATGVGWPSGMADWWPSAVLVLLLLVVVAADQVAVHRLLRSRFRAGQFSSDYHHAEPAWERWIRGMGQQRFRTQLDRAVDADEYSAHAADQADVIVHEGPTPFVGAGWVVPTQTIALTLSPVDGRSPRPIDIARMHDRVAVALDELRQSPVVPGMRMEGILRREQLLISVEELVRHTGTELGATVLPQRDQPPQRHIPRVEARKLAKSPQRWARYYSCFRIESSNGDLVTSCYLFIGADSKGLSLKLTHCVLPPIHESYRRIDYLYRAGEGPVSVIGIELLRIPVTVWPRLKSLIRRLRPRRPPRRGLLVERYGAIRSLRERVTDDDKPPAEFLDTDAVLYTRTIDARLFDAIERYLEECGYNVVQFRRDVRVTIHENTLNIRNGKFSNSTISVGDGNFNFASGGGSGSERSGGSGSDSTGSDK